MKAWKHIVTGEFFDIQSIPNPLPSDYHSEEWVLSEITDEEIAALVKISNYTHTARGIAGLLLETTILFTHNMEVFL